MLRTYRVRIDIVNIDRGPDHHSEINLNVSSDCAERLLDHAKKIIPSFAMESPVDAHARLVGEQNKEPVDADEPADEPADDNAGS